MELKPEEQNPTRSVKFIMGFLIILTFIFYPLADLHIFFNTLKIYVVTGSIFIGFSIIYNLKNRDNRFLTNSANSFTFALLLFMFWSTISIIWSHSHVATVQGLIKLWFVFLFSWSLTLTKKEENQYFNEIIFIAVNFSMIIVSSIIYYKLIFVYTLGSARNLFLTGNTVSGGNGLFGDFVYRVFVSYPIQNSQNITLSIMVTLIALSTIFMLKSEKKLFKYVYYCCLVYSSLIFYFGMSKSAMLGLGILIFFFGFIGFWHNNKYLKKTFMFVIIINVLILIINPLYIREGLLQRFSIVTVGIEQINQDQQSTTTPVQKDQQSTTVPVQNDQQSPSAQIKNDDTITSRLSLLHVALSEFKKNPLIGIGYRALGPKLLSTPGILNDNPHNIYGQNLAELGVIGFIIHLNIFILMFWNIRKNKDPYVLILCAAIISYLVRGLFELQFAEIEIWVMLLLVSSYISKIKEESKSDNYNLNKKVRISL